MWLEVSHLHTCSVSALVMNHTFTNQSVQIFFVLFYLPRCHFSICFLICGHVGAETYRTSSGQPPAATGERLNVPRIAHIGLSLSCCSNWFSFFLCCCERSKSAPAVLMWSRGCPVVERCSCHNDAGRKCQCSSSVWLNVEAGNWGQGVSVCSGSTSPRTRALCSLYLVWWFKGCLLLLAFYLLVVIETQLFLWLYIIYQR